MYVIPTYDDTADQFSFLGDPHAAVETFAEEPVRGTIRRDILLRNGATASSMVYRGNVREIDPASAFDLAWLRTRVRPPMSDARGMLRMVDLFSGCGSMSLGVWEACRALNLRPVPLLAIDINTRALGTYGRNFPNAVLSATPVEMIIGGRIGDPTSSAEAAFRDELGPVDLLLGGPPCQGHSDLNNHTRRDDPKNRLYLRMARFAEVVRPRAILIENVPGALHDRSGVVQETLGVLRLLGYSVSTGIVHAERLGVPQRRRRFFTIASLGHEIDLATSIAPYHRAMRSVSWAISDLLDRVETGPFDTPAKHSATNQARIEYLFSNALYELPDDQRPDCHRLKAHSYKSVYGRLRPDEPAPTITTGFGSTGQGRFVHPTLPRTLTPHEAARVQFIPDFFDFGDERRGALQDMIGNAVPPKISYLLALELLR